MDAGFCGEALAWREWLLRAVAGDPADIQIMYGVAGERRIEERELDWLPGYLDSRPVRVGNAASHSCSSISSVKCGRCHQTLSLWRGPLRRWLGVAAAYAGLAGGWLAPGGRGHLGSARPRRHFTHSKVMAWVAFDRGVTHLPGVRAGGTGRALGSPARRNPCRHLQERLARREARQLCPVLWGRLDASLLLLPTVPLFARIRRANCRNRQRTTPKRRDRMELSAGGRALLQGATGDELQTIETEGQMLQRVMPELMGMKNILVLNDEAHHCYREKPPDSGRRRR